MMYLRSISRCMAAGGGAFDGTSPLLCHATAAEATAVGVLPGIEILAPAANTVFVITPEPAMPVIHARAQIVGITPDPTAFTEFEWTAKNLFDSASCDHGRRSSGSSRVIESPVVTGKVVGGSWTVQFPAIRGGALSLAVKATINGECWQAESRGLRIEAMNPRCSDLLAALPHDTLRRIACHESGLRQFRAARDGGQGACPLFSEDNLLGAGIFQITYPPPTDEQIWNWRENLAAGVAVFNSKIASARAYPGKVAQSQAFRDLAAKTNQFRRTQGLPAVQISVPPFTRGNFNGNLQQLEDDVIRGYNGWAGRDVFGLPLHEFRLGTNADGTLALHIDAQANTGSAIWERVPPTQRPRSGDPNYVANIKAISLSQFTR